MKSHFLCALVLVLAGMPAARAANDIDTLQFLSQAEFRDFSTDLSSALSYKALNPTEPMGITGFDVGVDLSATQTQYPGVWRKATGESLDTLPVPRIRVMKGLPLGFDVGGFYSAVPNTNIKLYGAELRYALVEGGALTPAVGLRLATTRLSGVDQLGFQTRSADISISKGFGPVTPYGGVGHVWADSNPDASTGLQDESISQNKVYAGVRFSLAIMNLDLEADRTGDAKTYSLKFAFGF